MRMICLCCFTFVSLLAAAPPAWVQDDAARARLYPAPTYLTAVGLSSPSGTEVERVREAQGAARQELAASLRVRVRAEFSNQTTVTQTTAQGRTTGEGQRLVKNLVQTAVDLDLEGLDRLETWVDPRSGTAHALAVLDRAKAAGLLAERLKGQAAQARSEWARARTARDLEGLLKVRALLKRHAEGASLLRVLGGSGAPEELPAAGEVDQAAKALLEARPGLDGRIDAAIYALGADLPGGLRAMVDRIVYGQTRFSSTFGAYLEQRLTERLPKFDGVQLLDRSLASRAEGGPQAQALLHGSYLDLGREVSLLLKVTALDGTELATSQVKLERAWLDRAGLRLLPENHAAAAQSLAILDTEVPPSDLRINLQLDRGDGGIYRKDELMHLFLKADRDCYVRVVYQQVDGTKVQVFPNRYHPDGHLRGGVATRIPAEGDGFELRVTPPFGSEIVKVFASTEPFELAPVVPEGPMARVDASLGALTSRFRGIRVEKAKALTAEATAVVNTVEASRK